MRTLLTVLIMATGLPSVALLQTLCHSGEVDYFSCKISKSGKIASLCGNVDDSAGDGKDWLQYRFGSNQNVELIFPEEKRGSTTKFEANAFLRYGVYDLRFINGNALYSVEYEEPFSGDGATKRKTESGSVWVSIGERYIKLNCAKGSISSDTNKFVELFFRLGSPEAGKEDFLSRFYKMNRK